MNRSLVETADLPYAIRWERLREGYYRRQGKSRMAKYCADLAGWHQARLNKILEDQLDVA